MCVNTLLGADIWCCLSLALPLRVIPAIWYQSFESLQVAMLMETDAVQILMLNLRPLQLEIDGQAHLSHLVSVCALMLEQISTRIVLKHLP